MKVCDRAAKTSSFLVMDILERAHALEREGRDIVHLEIGEPDFETPECIKAAACRALAEGRTHYTHSQGIIELREIIAGRYGGAHGLALDPGRIFVTQGTSPAMLLVFTALLEPGDKVVITDPGYACYANFIRLAGGEPVTVPLRPEKGYRLDISDLIVKLDAEGGRVRAVVVNSPANPTGTVLDTQTMTDLARLARDRRFILVSDEIYHGLIYEGEERSLLEFDDQAFVLNGFSKAFAMTGFRLGYVVVPDWAVSAMRCLAQNLFICANSMAQWAGVTALREAARDVARMRAVYDERRRFMIDTLQVMGFHLPARPTGAFYVFIPVPEMAAKFKGSSLALCRDILERAGVGVTPGVDFGPGGEGCIRLSYANSLARIREGLERLGRYFERI
ncbi:MAG: pyridoxal phosphate-dependent aminotransferase [Deltaproteobacteria bacterium]|nr:pyridoxal phosphate-dependent aminotransferase [Deltaproteobacteria bacterium]